MSTLYPGALDALTNPISTNTLASPPHSSQHSDANDAIEALEAKLGVGTSAPATAYHFLSATAAGTSAWGSVIGAGDAQQMYNLSVPTVGQLLAVTKGTAAAPDLSPSPLLKVTRTVAVADADLGTGDAVDQLASIMGISVGTTALAAQPVGVAGMAKHSGTTTGSSDRRPDACGVYGVGRVTGSGTGAGFGGVFVGRRDNDTGRATGIEVHVSNYGSVGGTYLPAGASDLKGIWLNASGNANSGVGIQIQNAFGRQFQVGIGFGGQVFGGLTGAVVDSSVRDDSSSTISLDIRGSHTYGLDLGLGTYTTGAIRLPNSTGAGGILARNAAGTGQLNLMYLNASDNIILGANVAGVQVNQNLTILDAKNIVLGTTTGTRIGNATTQKIGFWNATPVVQQTITGSRGANAALADLLTKLATVGLIVDSTSA